MLFNSFEFLVFFIVVTVSFFSLPHRFRWALLLVSSCLFYMAFIPKYILILGFTIVVDYFAGLLIEQERNKAGKKARLYLIASLIANIGVLATFKYYNFFNESLVGLLNRFGIEAYLPFIKIALPIGLSFHTFQAMSYTIEVYRGHQKAERHFGIYSLYVMFYPQLVAGPIERPQNILHQFHEKQYFDAGRVASGLRLMLWGLFKKVVIADRLATFTDPVFTSPDKYSSLVLLTGVLFFSYQIYCDFSGYSDIAIGSARVMGFQLMKNFDSPYQSRTISEFWTRWHISLSTWFRDYLYIPLGGNRVSVPRWYFNLLFVFIVSGLWHGANWTFMLWGLLHGFYLVFALVTRKVRQQISDFLGSKKYPIFFTLSEVAVTFGLVSFAWIFFRADSVSKAWLYISRLKDVFKDLYTGVLQGAIHIGIPSMGVFDLVISFILIAVLELFQYLNRKKDLVRIFSRQPAYARWIVYYGAILVIIFLGVFDKRSFIYFQF